MRQGRGGSRPSASSWKRREWGAPAGATLSFLSTAGSIAQLRGAASAELPGNLRFVEVPDGAGLPAAKGPVPVPVPRQMELFMAAAEAGGLKAGLEAARAAAGGAKVSCVVGDAFVWPAAEVPPPSSLLPPLCRRTPLSRWRPWHGGGGGGAPPPPSSLLLLLPPPSYSLPELERIWASPRLLAGARADRHARRACPLAAPAATTSPAMPAAFAMRAVAVTPAMPAALRGGRAGPLVVPRHPQRRRPRPPCPLRLPRSLRAPRPPRARRTGAAGPALCRGA